jgi:putative endonuclease
MHHVYLIFSDKDGKFFKGSTEDLKRRIAEHEAGYVKSTVRRKPLKLIYYEACLNEADARVRERYLKSGAGKKYLRNRLKRYLENL